MLMSSNSHRLMASAGAKVASESWLVQDPAKHSWIGQSVADASYFTINREASQFAKAGEGDNPDRERMRQAIRRRVMADNEKCGFIILPIILAAILTWIIKRILDRWFNGDFNS